MNTATGAAEWAELASWIDRWAPAAQPQPTLEALGEQPAPQRAILLQEVGLEQEAIIEWRHALDQARQEAHQLALLARLASEQHQHGVAIEIAEALLVLAPGEYQAGVPALLDRLRYPTPYAEAVAAAAAEQQIDPALLYGLIRQESTFYPAVVSVAGARGLTQIMPATGAGLAQGLGLTGYHERDLVRPGLNIRFGARYLGTQLHSFGQRTEVALAAYNGGPGNAQRWLELPNADDPDLFVEQIDFVETRTYIKRVYTNADTYRRIYRR
jgi:soluble lytic murein transglycosylase